MLCSWVKVNTSIPFVERIHFNTAEGEISERITREISTLTFLWCTFHNYISTREPDG